MQSNSDNSTEVRRAPEKILDARIEHEVACLARDQHGLITLAQLRQLGVSRSAARDGITSGRWRAQGPTVVQVKASPLTWEARLLAPILGASDLAVASHRSAAALWGIAGFDRTHLEISVPRSRNPRRRGELVVHRSGDLALAPPVVRCGIPTTPIGRTLLDLGAVVSRSRMERAIDDARRQGLVDWRELVDTLVLHSRRGRDGVGLLRSFLDRHFAEVVQVEGVIERLVWLLLKNANLPPPVLGHEVCLNGELYRLALAFTEGKVALQLESDGELSSETKRSAVYARLNALSVAGWKVLRFAHRDYHNRPGKIVRYTRDVLAASLAG